MSKLFFCPKYLGILVAFSILKDFQNSPKWLDWKWWLIVGFALFTFGSIIYGRVQQGISIGILADIFWFLLYLIVLYIYLPKFDNKEQVDKRVDEIPLKLGHVMMTMTGVIIGLCITILILCISQFIPIVDFVTIPIVRVLSVVL
jgi:uncharacterized protein YacL